VQVSGEGRGLFEQVSGDGRELFEGISTAQV
jgi:hypothetical protein